MKVKFSGIYSIQEFKSALQEIIEKLEESNVDSISSCNLYFSCKKDGLPVIIVDSEENEIEWNHVKRNVVDNVEKNKIVRFIPYY